MKLRRLLIALVGLVPTVEAQSPEEGNFEKRGDEILKKIVSQNWADEWKGATLEKIHLVKQKPGLLRPTGLPPVWVGTIKGPEEKTGLIMWESVGGGKLVEFTLDADLKIPGAIAGVPNLQQFPVKGEDGKEIASGCVPTAAGSVLSYWANRGFPQWRGEDGKTPADLTKRLRAQLKMTPFPDADGFTGNGMTLAGAFPRDLAAAIGADALAKGVKIDCRIFRFSYQSLQKEIEASRPVLLSCLVRVPHKPHLSWGHEVAGVARATIDGVDLVGVVDNFYPTKHPEAIRWIRKDAFLTLIMLRPEESQ